MTQTEAIINGARNHYGIPTVWVDPYRITDRSGTEVLVEFFEDLGPFMVAHGRKIRKNGQPSQVRQQLNGVQIPQAVAKTLGGLKEAHD